MNIETGTLIHGTLRTEDLIQAFVAELERIKSECEDERTPASLAIAAKIGDATSYVREEQDRLGKDFGFWPEEGEEILARLFDLLDEIAPDGFYFGAHAGDGSDFGFWPSEEEDEEDE